MRPSKPFVRPRILLQIPLKIVIDRDIEQLSNKRHLTIKYQAPPNMLDAIPTIVIALTAIGLGIAGLVWSADRFVAGAASIAEGFGIAPIIVGLTIVSFGTSAPEVMVSIMAAMEGSGALAVGNALGSNIANVGLVLGITLLIARIPVQGNLLKHEGLILIGLILLSGLFLWDAAISALEGWVLLGLLIPVMWYLAVTKQKDHSPDELLEEFEQDIDHYSPKLAIVWFLIGLIALVASSKVLVWGAVTTAEFYGVSQLIIGLSIVALGTSLPELAAAVISALKGHHDIAIGAVIGSNIFNLLAVMSIPGIFGSDAMEPEVFNRDYVAMLAVTLLLFFAMGFHLYRHRENAHLGKLTGILLLSMYIGYMLLIAQSQFALA